MENTSYVALSRQTALWNRMDVVANNLANMNTDGYRAQHSLFHDYVVKAPGGEGPFDEKIAYVQDYGNWRDTRPGPVHMTGNPLDVAIEGEGFFRIDTPEGERFSRLGRFHLDNEGQIVTAQGHPVLSEAGEPFFLAPNERDVTINGDGSVSTENGLIGNIALASFEDQQKLRSVGHGLFTTDQDPQPVDTPNLVQGGLEGSNVKPLQEMTNMIEVQRAFEATQQMIEREDQRLSKAIETITKTR